MMGAVTRRRSWWPIAAALTLALVSPAGAADAPGGSPADSPATERARALIKPRAQAVLSSEIAGRILRMPMREGEAFHKGDRLVEFDCAWFSASRDAARAGLEHARAKLDSLESLASLRSTGALEVNQARADLDKAKAELQVAGLTVERCVITAPFNGRVVETKAHAFESVAQSTPLLTVLDDSDLEVALVIPATWLVWLKPGQVFLLALDETSHSHEGRVTRLGAQVDPVSQTVTVFGSLRDGDHDVIPGMSGTAHFTRPETPAKAERKQP